MCSCVNTEKESKNWMMFSGGENPRAKKRVKKNGVWVEQEQKVMHGDVLYKILCTMQRKYGVEFLFCDKKDTGKRILEILSNG